MKSPNFTRPAGTTGQPVYQPDTWQDWEWWAECWSYILGMSETARNQLGADPSSPGRKGKMLITASERLP